MADTAIPHQAVTLEDSVEGIDKVPTNEPPVQHAGKIFFTTQHIIFNRLGDDGLRDIPEEIKLRDTFSATDDLSMIVCLGQCRTCQRAHMWQRRHCG